MNIIVAIGRLIFRRGTGLFKLLFAIDDLIRLFAITLIMFLSLTILEVSGLFFTAAMILAIVIDVHDVFDDIKEGKPLDLGFN